MRMQEVRSRFAGDLLRYLSMLPNPPAKRAIILPILCVIMAAGIFALDTATNLEIAVPVLYVAVVLVAVRFLEKRGVVLVSASCVALTVLSYVLTAEGVKQAGLINTGISLLAVGITTFLALKIELARFTAKTLVEADQLRDALIDFVSHELRTPLASILGGISILADMPTVMKDPRLASLANGSATKPCGLIAIFRIC